jgi:hypothetical protein
MSLAITAPADRVFLIHCIHFWFVLLRGRCQVGHWNIFTEGKLHHIQQLQCKEVWLHNRTVMNERCHKIFVADDSE